MHEQQLDVLGVVDEESLVAGGHHVLGLLVATVTDLFNPSACILGQCLVDSIESVEEDVRKAWGCCP